jgi:hypothetical protein
MYHRWRHPMRAISRLLLLTAALLAAIPAHAAPGVSPPAVQVANGRVSVRFVNTPLEAAVEQLAASVGARVEWLGVCRVQERAAGAGRLRAWLAGALLFAVALALDDDVVGVVRGAVAIEPSTSGFRSSTTPSSRSRRSRPADGVRGRPRRSSLDWRASRRRSPKSSTIRTSGVSRRRRALSVE